MKQTHLLTTLLLAPLAGLHAAETPASADKPNIVFILADDAGIGDFSCYGCKYGVTPNIDRLAKEGMLFTHAYSGNAVCCPSRCVLMTGLHPGHALFRANDSCRPTAASRDGVFSLPANQMTVARVLHDAGYATGGFGKWGLGNPGTTGAAEKEGFDEFFGYYDQVHAHNYYTDHLVRNGRERAHPARRKADLGGLFAHAHRQRDAQVHRAEQGSALLLLRGVDAAPRRLCHPVGRTVFQEAVGASTTRTTRPWSSLIDQDVGRVVQKLKDLGIEKNTLVIFSSDNGANQQFIKPLGSTGGLRGYKRLLYEGGIRAPFIARWPGRIKPGTTSDLLTTFVDVLPTAADLAGATLAARARWDLDCVRRCSGGSRRCGTTSSTSKSTSPSSSNRCGGAIGRATVSAPRPRSNFTT